MIIFSQLTLFFLLLLWEEGYVIQEASVSHTISVATRFTFIERELTFLEEYITMCCNFTLGGYVIQEAAVSPTRIIATRLLAH